MSAHLKETDLVSSQLTASAGGPVGRLSVYYPIQLKYDSDFSLTLWWTVAKTTNNNACKIKGRWTIWPSSHIHSQRRAWNTRLWWVLTSWRATKKKISHLRNYLPSSDLHL